MEMHTGGSGNRLLTLGETMAYLRVSRSTMYRLIQRKELAGYKIGRRWMFDRGDLRAFMASKRMERLREPSDCSDGF